MRAGDVREVRTYRWQGRRKGAPAERKLDVHGFLASYWEDEARPGTPLSFSREEKDALRAIGYISE